MSLWTRIANVFRGDRLNRDIDEELRSHIEEAIELGRDPDQVRRAFGPLLLRREESRDIRIIPWLESLRADAVFGWRQLKKNKVASATAILSLGLTIGACASAFRLIDALLLRPLPVTEPERLYAFSHVGVGNDGKPQVFENEEYPLFRRMRTAVRDHAELIAISNNNTTADITYGSDQDMERAYVQHVSGWMFNSFGLRPAQGRLFTENDDIQPGAHPYAVISHDYWTRRLAKDPAVVGRAFRMGGSVYTIVGVCEARFTGTQPGIMTDIFVPTMMHPSVTRSDSGWVGTWARLKPGVTPEPVRERLRATFRAFREERAKGFHGWPKQRIDRFVNETVLLEPATAGFSRLQRDYLRPLVALGVLVALVLLIASANVANLMTAQAAARGREMALRVAIGAGRRRLVQLVLVEGAWMALLAGVLGALFAWWSAPWVVSMISPPNNPIRLILPADWRVLGFGAMLTSLVILLSGLIPAFRASEIQPAGAMRGGDIPHSRRRTMHALIAVQAAFCFLVLFVAGLFVTTFDRLTHQPTGFSSTRILTLEATAKSPQPTGVWEQTAEHLRAVPGVEQVALAGFALLTGTSNSSFVSINGAPTSETPAQYIDVSPGWIGTMKIALIDGRDFRAADANPGAVIVNQAFAEEYFGGANPVGRSFAMTGDPIPLTIVGLIANARYRYLREPVPPVMYLPFRRTGPNAVTRRATFVVRTSSPEPLALAQTLRREIPRARPEFRVSGVRTQMEIIESQTLRERLLATLGLFFAGVAVLLAGVGLFGVLDYSVLQRRREIGIRMAIGARAGDIARRVTSDVFSMVLIGAAVGLAVGLRAARYVEALLYDVKPTDLSMLTLPSAAILAAALLAALPAVVRAVRIDPVKALHSD